jgi:parallel beta-helix repeat protein
MAKMFRFWPVTDNSYIYIRQGMSKLPTRFVIVVVIFVVGLSILLLQSVLISVHRNAAAVQCVEYDYHTNIITVSCNTNLSEINQVINDRSVLEKDPLGVWILKAIIKVNPLAQLTINQTDTSWLKITNKNNTEPNFITVSGALKIDGIKITSWDPSSKNVIRQNVNGSIPRPYIWIDRAYGNTNISNSEVAFLGYASKVGGTNGFYDGGNGSSILNNTFHDLNLDNNNKNNLFKNNHMNYISQPINPAPMCRNPQMCSITITNPPTQNQTILTNFITINGTTSHSSASGIKEVEVLVNKIPSNVTASYKLAIPLAQGNWSRWSFPVVLQQAGLYSVKARVTDNAGDQDTSDVTIHFPDYIYNKRVALVEPTFTYAAYRSGGFYNFYQKYSLIDTKSNNKTITTNLNLLKNRPIPHGPFPYFSHPRYLDIPYYDYFQMVQNHVKKDPFVTHFTDVDVHRGKIFQPGGSNAYDVLFLFHNEYETQAEYNNLRQFVSNGGTIVFTEGNVLTAEVSYDKANDSITLVRGHYWKLDSKGATPSVSERWLDENREWMGSNFFDVPSYQKVKFRNNPFNYTHNEEQYVTNPEAKIMIDYKVYNIPGKYSYRNATVATYQMNYLVGKVINLGIWGHVVDDNKAFLNYFDNVIIPLALGPPVNSTQYIDKFSSINGGIFVTTPATSPSGAIVNYLLPFKNIGSNFNTVCTPPPGSAFPVGETKVKCTATDIGDKITTLATITVKVTAEPCASYNLYTNTINVMCKTNLSQINELINNSKVLEKRPHGVWILNSIIRVNPKGELSINRTDTSWLKITNETSNINEVNFILISGSARIDGVKITSWNPRSNDVIRQNVNDSATRPYILINNSSGSTNISNSEIAFLGLALDPLKYGLSYNSGQGGNTIANNTFHDMSVGLYSNSVGSFTIKNNKYNNNKIFGIAINKSSDNKIFNNLLKSSHVSILVGDDSKNNHVYNNTITNSTFGLYVAGSRSKNNLLESNHLSEIPYPITMNGVNNLGKNNAVSSR